MSCFSYFTSNILTSTTFIVAQTNESDYAVIVVLNMELPPNFGTAQAYFTHTHTLSITEGLFLTLAANHIKAVQQN